LKSAKVVGPDTVVSLEMEMRDAQGGLIHTSDEPLRYLHGGYGGVFDGIERMLEGKAVGETVQVQLEPDEAFGDYDAELVRIEDRNRYGEGLEPGMEVEDAFDEEEARTYVVTDLAEDKVVLDGNHPLAGIALRFTCKVLSVRNATDEEVERGSVDEDAGGDAES
jgi:FKBP-type peptidyl-prolyl cis-trans isomerase SlyD